MRIRCEDHWHQLSPTAMAIVIDAFQEGDLITTNTRTVRCIKFAFTTERIHKFLRVYKGNHITFEREDLLVLHPTLRSGRVQTR